MTDAGVAGESARDERGTAAKRLNLLQRIVLVVALGAGLSVFGLWVTTFGSYTGWVAYAPLNSAGAFAGPVSGLYSWVRLVIWLALIAIWALASMWLLRRSTGKSGSAAQGPG